MSDQMPNGDHLHVTHVQYPTVSDTAKRLHVLSVSDARHGPILILLSTWPGHGGELGLLEIAGLSQTEESVYLAVLGLPPFTPGDACQACTGMDREELRGILDSLTDKGLLTQLSVRPRRYAPLSPATAFEAHLAKREEQLRQARAALADLTERYRAVPRHTATDELAEIVTGKRRTWQRWMSSLSSARCQVRVLNRPPFETEVPDPDPAELEVLRRGVPVRFVYDDYAVRSSAVIARRRAELAAGEQARITGEVPVHLLLVDSNLALMPLGRDRLRSDGLLVVYPCALLDALSVLFELGFWHDSRGNSRCVIRHWLRVLVPRWVVCDRDIVDVVFPHLNAVLVERVEREGDAVRVVARSRGEPVPCPSCGTPAGKVHGYCRRRLADSPAGGAPVLLELTLRRLVCANLDCALQTFHEQVPGLAGRAGSALLAAAGVLLSRCCRVSHFVRSSNSSCMLCQNDSIMALSKQSPAVPIEPSSPESRIRFPDAHPVYCVP